MFCIRMWILSLNFPEATLRCRHKTVSPPLTPSDSVGPRFPRKAPSCPRTGLGHQMIPSIPLACQALICEATCLVCGHTYICGVQIGGGLQFKRLKKCLTIGIHFTSKAGLAPASLLPTLLSKVCTMYHVYSAKETNFGRIVLWGGRGVAAMLTIQRPVPWLICSIQPAIRCFTIIQ